MIRLQNWTFFSRYWHSSLIRDSWCRPSDRRQSQVDIACAHSISSDDPRSNEPGLANDSSRSLPMNWHSREILKEVCELKLETMIEYLERTEWEINRSSRRRDRCLEQERERADLVHTRFRFRCSFAMTFRSRLSFTGWHDSHALLSLQDAPPRWFLKMNEATRWLFQFMRRK